MYEIYAYGNNDSLYGIFNAIAAIMGANSYLQAIAMVAFCGFVTAGIAYAFMPHKLIGWQWLASVLLVYSILFVPKVTVGIVDKLGTQPVQVVSNVPFGVAFFGNLTSTIGNTLTEVFETAFQTLPGPAQQSADLTYQRHGVMFGNTLIKRTRQIVFDDPNFRTDLVNFIHNCTMFDLADGTIDPATFSKAPVGAGDLWSLMATPNPARFSSITTGGVSDIQPCPAVYANLNARLPAITNLSVQKLAALLNPNLPLAQAVTEVSNQATQAYLRASLGNAGTAVADIVRQNGLINAINDTSDIIGQKINDPGSLILGLGRAQATAQTNAAWLNFGKMAEDALPLIRNAIEAIIYALFPLVILLLLLTYGLGTMRALQSYLLTLVWIQLWPPVYAILNYMASIASAKHIAAAAELGAGINGLAIVSASAVYSNTISDQAVVGYLVLAVPAIAWAAVKGMHTIGQAALTGTSSIQGAASGAAAAAGTGNVSMGMVSQDHVNLSPTYSSANARFSTDAWGTRAETIRADGSVAFVAAQQNMSRLATRFEFSETRSHVDVRQRADVGSDSQVTARGGGSIYVCNSRQCNERAAGIRSQWGAVGWEFARNRRPRFPRREHHAADRREREQDARLRREMRELASKSLRMPQPASRPSAWVVAPLFAVAPKRTNDSSVPLTTPSRNYKTAVWRPGSPLLRAFKPPMPTNGRSVLALLVPSALIPVSVRPKTTVAARKSPMSSRRSKRGWLSSCAR